MTLELRTLQVRWPWPPNCPAQRLRPWLLERLKQDGQPLRWAITAVEIDDEGQKHLHLEAVVL